VVLDGAAWTDFGPDKIANFVHRGSGQNSVQVSPNKWLERAGLRQEGSRVKVRATTLFPLAAQPHRWRYGETPRWL
jgi:hypothetical protein